MVKKVLLKLSILLKFSKRSTFLNLSKFSTYLKLPTFPKLSTLVTIKHFFMLIVWRMKKNV